MKSSPVMKSLEGWLDPKGSWIASEQLLRDVILLTLALRATNSHGGIIVKKWRHIYICERLDRAAANDKWCEAFPEFAVINGRPRHSDHRAVIVFTKDGGGRGPRGDRGFHLKPGGSRRKGAMRLSRMSGRRAGWKAREMLPR